MSKSILVIDTPAYCANCPFKEYQDWSYKTCQFTGEEIPFDYRERLPQCPLQDTTELLEALEDTYFYESSFEPKRKCKGYNKLHKALGGESK